MCHKIAIQFFIKQHVTVLALVFMLLITGRSSASDRIIAGYYPAWTRYSLTSSKIPYENLTHIIHAFAWPTSSGELEYYSDLLYPDMISKAHQHNVQVLIALGGWGNCDGFPGMVSDSLHRATFIENLVTFCSIHGYDGIDFDWEYPSGSTQRRNLNLLIQELHTRIELEELNLLLTMAVPAGDWSGSNFDFTFLKNYIDWFGCMSYDFFGSWVSMSGHNSPLYPPAQNNNGSVQSAINYLQQSRGIPKNKILAGIPLYGRGCNATGYNQPNTGGDVSYGYKDIAPLIGNGWDYFWDNTSKVPYLLNSTRTKFITFDDTLSVRLKCEFALERDLGGVMLWSLGQDLINQEEVLVNIVSQAMHGSTPIFAVPFEPIPADQMIIMNYPNPFNSQTIISYNLPRSAFTVLTLYDNLGRKLATLFSRQENAGWHQFILDGSHLASGMYYCYLFSGSEVQTHRLFLIK